MKTLYDEVSINTSRYITKKYSTSFSMGIRFFHKSLRTPIYSIYGFVRLADEIVDTFHDYDKASLFDEFKKDTYKAIGTKISLNPVLNSFQKVVHDYNIDKKWIDLFLKSMEMDLNKSDYNLNSYKEYILGSAEVVGLMCLHVFCHGNKTLFNELKDNAMKLGSAYQKVNFLRDLRQDFNDLGRTYFPGVNIKNFTESQKQQLIDEIDNDFKTGYKGIVDLPKQSRFGVFLSYVYFYSLLRKIKRTPVSHLLEKRVRIPNTQKYALLLFSSLRFKLTQVKTI